MVRNRHLAFLGAALRSSARWCLLAASLAKPSLVTLCLVALCCGTIATQADAQVCCTDASPAEMRRFYVSANALYLDRPSSAQTVLSQRLSIVPGSAALFTDSVDPAMKPGVELTLGMATDECTAFELSYFGLHFWEASRSVVDPTENLQTPFSNSGLYTSTSNLLDDFFDAREQGVHYTSRMHNIEFNIRRQISRPVELIAGLRYINFDEKMHYYSIDDAWSSSDVGLYNVDVMNNLVGLQFGSRADCQVTNWLGLSGTAKGGMFLNWMQHDTLLLNTGPDILAEGSKSTLGLSGVIDADLKAVIRHNHCQLVVGYRVLLLSGMATAADQFDFAINEDPAAIFGSLNHQGAVLLHGPFAGLTAEF